MTWVVDDYGIFSSLRYDMFIKRYSTTRDSHYCAFFVAFYGFTIWWISWVKIWGSVHVIYIKSFPSSTLGIA